MMDEKYGLSPGSVSLEGIRMLNDAQKEGMRQLQWKLDGEAWLPLYENIAWREGFRLGAAAGALVGAMGWLILEALIR